MGCKGSIIKDLGFGVPKTLKMEKSYDIKQKFVQMNIFLALNSIPKS